MRQRARPASAARARPRRTSAQAERQRGLEADDAERRAWSNSTSFSSRVVRRVIGGDDVDGAVGEPAAQRVDVGAPCAAAGSSWRWCRSRRPASSVSDEVVRRHLARSRAAPRALRVADQRRRVAACSCARRGGARRCSSASAMSRATMTDSAVAGHARAGRARERVEPLVHRRRRRADRRSSSCAMTGRSNMRGVLERAPHQHRRRITGRPSSETATLPARVQLADLGQLLALRARATRAPIG